MASSRRVISPFYDIDLSGVSENLVTSTPADIRHQTNAKQVIGSPRQLGKSVSFTPVRAPASSTRTSRRRLPAIPSQRSDPELDLSRESALQEPISQFYGSRHLPSTGLGFRPTGDTAYSAISRVVPRKEKQPDTFDGSSSEWQDYIVHFEQVASWNGWSEIERAQQLSMSLRGTAQKLLSNLTVGQLSDYYTMKSVLEQRFNPKERVIAYRCEFRNRKQGKSESASDFGYNLRRLALQAYPQVPYSSLEQQVIDQFINGLSIFDMRKKVSFSHPQTLDQAISSAVEYEAVVGDRLRKPQPTESSDSVGAIGSSGTSQEQPSSSLTLDDIVKLIDKKLASKGDKSEKANVTDGCHYCKKPGHWIANCPKLAAKNSKAKEQSEGSLGN